jgi:sialic acid synthase SpsE
LLQAAAGTGRKILLSTGMSTLGEIEQAVAALDRVGAADVVLLHCVSAYPCPTEISNVGFVEVLRTSFGLPVGFSDHTESSEAAIAAVALGATWIEKHLTLDRGAKGFDHAYAMEPEMLAAYIASLRAAAAALRRPAEKVGEAERAVMTRARRGLWAVRDLSPGAVLTEADVVAVRPAGPLTPADLPRILGRRLRHGVSESGAIRLEDLE